MSPLLLSYRNILRSVLIAVPMVTAVYFMMNVAYMTVLSIPEMTSSPAVAVVTNLRYSLTVCAFFSVIPKRFDPWEPLTTLCTLKGPKSLHV
jgi:hypothetical protein